MKGTCLQLFYVKFYILLYFYFTIYKQKTNNIFIKCNYDSGKTNFACSIGRFLHPFCNTFYISIQIYIDK